MTETTDADLIALLCNGPVTTVERKVIAGRLAALAQENDDLKICLAAEPDTAYVIARSQKRLDEITEQLRELVVVLTDALWSRDNRSNTQE